MSDILNKVRNLKTSLRFLPVKKIFRLMFIRYSSVFFVVFLLFMFLLTYSCLIYLLDGK